MLSSQYAPWRGGFSVTSALKAPTDVNLQISSLRACIPQFGTCTRKRLNHHGVSPGHSRPQLPMWPVRHEQIGQTGSRNFERPYKALQVSFVWDLCWNWQPVQFSQQRWPCFHTLKSASHMSYEPSTIWYASQQEGQTEGYSSIQDARWSMCGCVHNLSCLHGCNMVNDTSKSNCYLAIGCQVVLVPPTIQYKWK